MSWTAANEAIALRGIDSEWEPIILRETGGDWALGALVRAIIAIESNWINGRVNPADPSYGLMQIRAPGGPTLPPGVRAEDLQWDADANIRTGVSFLRYLLGRYPLESDAIAAYNAGSPRRGADGRYLNQAYVDQVTLYLVWYQNHLPGTVAEPVPATSGNWLTNLFGAHEAEPLPPVAETVPSAESQAEPAAAPAFSGAALIAGLAAVVLFLIRGRGVR